MGRPWEKKRSQIYLCCRYKEKGKIRQKQFTKKKINHYEETWDKFEKFGVFYEGFNSTCPEGFDCSKEGSWKKYGRKRGRDSLKSCSKVSQNRQKHRPPKDQQKF